MSNQNGDVIVESDRNADEAEFMAAIERSVKRTGRKFPTMAEVFAEVQAMGYTKS